MCVPACVPLRMCVCVFALVSMCGLAWGCVYVCVFICLFTEAGLRSAMRGIKEEETADAPEP